MLVKAELYRNTRNALTDAQRENWSILLTKMISWQRSANWRTNIAAMKKILKGGGKAVCQSKYSAYITEREYFHSVSSSLCNYTVIWMTGSPPSGSYSEVPKCTRQSIYYVCVECFLMFLSGLQRSGYAEKKKEHSYRLKNYVHHSLDHHVSENCVLGIAQEDQNEFYAKSQVH